MFANAFFIIALSLLFLFGGKPSLEPGIKFISSREALGGLFLGMVITSGICFTMLRKWLPFAKLAAKIFCALEFPSPSDINLWESTKRLTAPDEDDEDEEDNGLYFKY
ncbi:hypothetical protein HWE01_11565 [Herbaspirillum sp. C7C8]|nr:hypothetical protein [Herbaspirillum sp. C7C8]